MKAEKRIALGGALALAIGGGIYGVIYVLTRKPPPVAENFVVSDLIIEPAEVYPEEPVSIGVTVTNVGEVAGSYTVTCEVLAKTTKKVTLNPGEAKQVVFEFVPTRAGTHQVSVDGLIGSFNVLEPPPIQLLDAWFGSGNPMTKEPTDSFTVSLKLKNTMDQERSPSNIRFGFGQANGQFSAAPIVWGVHPFTGEVVPGLCGDFGYWPVEQWPIIPAGGTETFTITYGLCQDAPAGAYDGFIEVDGQSIVVPDILTVSKVADAEILEGKLTRVVDGYQAHYFVEVTVKNNTSTTFGSADGTRLIAKVLRPSDRWQYGSYPYPPGYVDVPPGTTTFSWDFFGLSHWGMEKIVLPDPLDYILEVVLSLYLPYGQVALITEEFEGMIALG